MTTRPKKYRTGPSKVELAKLVVVSLVACVMLPGAIVSGDGRFIFWTCILIGGFLPYSILRFVNSKNVSYKDREDWQRNRVDNLDFDDKNVK